MKYFCEYNAVLYDTQEECLEAEMRFRLYEEIEIAQKEMYEAQKVYEESKEKYERVVQSFNRNVDNIYTCDNIYACDLEDMDIKILNPEHIEDKCECNCDGKCKVEETENGFVIYGNEIPMDEFISLLEEFIKFDEQLIALIFQRLQTPPLDKNWMGANSKYIHTNWDFGLYAP